MSSIIYGNEGLPSTDDPSTATILPHPYLNSNSNAAYATAAAAVAAVSSGSPSAIVGSYPHYYGHGLPSQQLFNMPQTTGFYQSALNPHGHQADFSTSSPSVASSSSSIESARKPAGNRKRNLPQSDKLHNTTGSIKTSSKRKLVSSFCSIRIRSN
jgi:hypothetical protein